MADELRAQATRKRLGKSVRFTGFLAEGELAALYAAADVAVVPSSYEPFGLVALEAAALGAPLVVARTGGLAELVQPRENGMHFPVFDHVALADAVTEVLSDDVLARRIARAAKGRLTRDHSWSTIAAQTVEIYARAVDEERVLVASQAARPELRMVVRDGNLLRDAP